MKRVGLDRMSQTRNWDSSMRTLKKSIRAIYANNLAQNTAVNAGKRLAVTAVSGPTSSNNSFTVAIDTGSTDLTPAEFNSVASQARGFAPITFTSTGTQLPNPFTVPPGYTKATVLVIAGGGGGSGGTTQVGYGGGAASSASGFFQIRYGDSITVHVSEGGTGTSSTTGHIGAPAFCDVYRGGNNIVSIACEGGAGGSEHENSVNAVVNGAIDISNLHAYSGQTGSGQQGGIVARSVNNTGNGGQGGPIGSAPDNMGLPGYPGYYSIVLT